MIPEDQAYSRLGNRYEQRFNPALEGLPKVGRRSKQNMQKSVALSKMGMLIGMGGSTGMQSHVCCDDLFPHSNPVNRPIYAASTDHKGLASNVIHEIGVEKNECFIRNTVTTSKEW